MGLGTGRQASIAARKKAIQAVEQIGIQAIECW
jgi:hypothetical protein